MVSTGGKVRNQTRRVLATVSFAMGISSLAAAQPSLPFLIAVGWQRGMEEALRQQ